MVSRKVRRHSQRHDRVLKTLAVSEGPLSAHELWERLKGESPGSIGIATVYRSLRRGVEEGQLVPVELGTGSTRYESASLDHHHHFLCVECGRVFDVAGCARDLHRLLPAGFEMTNHEILLHGRCAECRGVPRTSRQHRAP